MGSDFVVVSVTRPCIHRPSRNVGGITDHVRMTAFHPTIDNILDAFFPPLISESRGVLRDRLIRVMTAIDRFLEAEGEGVLAPDDTVVLAAERQFTGAGAFVRTMHAPDLVFALPGFLRPPWLHPDPLMQRVQLTVVQRLVEFVVDQVGLDQTGVAKPLAEIRAVILAARRELNRAHKESRRIQESPS
jgi:hypothetical protein